MASRSSISVTGNALGRREPCAKCSNAVFLAERLNVGTKLYHRTCFRCARCNNQLSLANCYETETGQYCCETCPDEEVENAKTEQYSNIKSADSFLAKLNRLDQFRNRSLSDEEKQKGLQKFDDDEYSADFENALEDSSEKIYQDDSFMSKARAQFLSTHLLNEDKDDALVPDINMKTDEDTPPPLPKNKPPDECASLTDIDPSAVPDKRATSTDASVNKLGLTDTVNNCKISNSNQQNTASDTMPEETTTLREYSTKDTNRSSLVKSRMLMFEAAEKTDEPDSIRNKVNVVSKYFNNSDVQKADLKSKVPSRNDPDADISVITISSEDSLLLKHDNSILDISDCSFDPNDSKFEERDFKTPKSTKTTYLSVSSENLDESDDCKLVRSEIGSDSLVLVSSVSDVNSPVIRNKEDSMSSLMNSTENLDESKSDIVIKSHLVEAEISSVDKIIDEIKEDLNMSADLQNQSTDSVFTSDVINTETTPSVILQLDNEESKEPPITSADLQNPSTDSVFTSNVIITETTPSGILQLNNEESKEPPKTSADLQNQSTDSVFTSNEITSEITTQLNNEEKKSDSLLTKSLLANLSDEMSPVAIDDSLLDSSNASKIEEYPEDLNPFGDDDEDIPVKNSRQLIKPSTEDLTIITPENARRKSTNPFGSSDEEDDKVEVKAKPPRPPLPAARKDDKKVISAPKISLNPFWSDEEEPEDQTKKPVPKPRTK